MIVQNVKSTHREQICFMIDHLSSISAYLKGDMYMSSTNLVNELIFHDTTVCYTLFVQLNH